MQSQKQMTTSANSMELALALGMDICKYVIPKIMSMKLIRINSSLINPVSILKAREKQMELRNITNEYDLNEYLQSLDATQEIKDTLSKMYEKAFWLGYKEGEIYASNEHYLQ